MHWCGNITPHHVKNPPDAKQYWEPARGQVLIKVNPISCNSGGNWRLGPPCCRGSQQPLLCIWSVCCHSSPVELSCQSVSQRRRVNQRCPHPERPACLHLLPWHRNSVVDRSGVAGSQSLYLPTHYIEPSCACVRHSQHGEQTKGAEGGEGRCQDSVSILRSGAVLPGLRCAACSSGAN